MKDKLDQELHDDRELEKLMETSDEELLREAAAEGQDVPALVRDMKRRIAERLRETRQHLSAAPEPRMYSLSAVPEAGHRLEALDPDVAGIDLEPVSYLAVLQHGWREEQVAVIEREYRGWLQTLKRDPQERITPSPACHLYWDCHLQRATLYLEHTTAIFGSPLLHWPGRTTDRRRDADPEQVLMRRLIPYVSDLADEEEDLAPRPSHETRREAPDERRAGSLRLVQGEVLSEHFEEDDEVQVILMGARKDLSPVQIQASFGMTGETYEQARRRLWRGLRHFLPDLAPVFQLRADWGTATVHVDEGDGFVERDARPALRRCSGCADTTAVRVLATHVLPVRGGETIQRIAVHQVEMDRCARCGLDALTLEGKIKVERCAHEALLYLREHLTRA